jgi:hypothetical protein
VQVPPRTPLAPVVETLLPVELKPLVPAVPVQGLLEVPAAAAAARLELPWVMEMPALRLAVAVVAGYRTKQLPMEKVALVVRVR